MNEKQHSNRWYLLALMLLTSFSVAGINRFSMLVLFREIQAELNLSLVDIGTIWGMDSLSAFFLCIPGGMLVDRFGIKKTAITYCLLAGVFGAVRGLTGGFAGLAAATFVYGLLAAMTVVTGPKVLAYYFRGRHLGLMTASLGMAVAVGQMCGTLLSATYLSPLLGGWRNVFFALAILPVIAGILWIPSRPDPPAETSRAQTVEPFNFKQILGRVARIKYLWVLGFVSFVNLGTYLSIGSYFPLYLKNIGWTAVQADGATTILLASSAIGMLPIVFFSDRLRNRRLFIFAVLAVVSVALALLFLTREAVPVIAIIVINGLLRSVPAPLVYTLILEMPEIRTDFVGTAIGFVSTISMLGGFIMPPVGNSFAAINPGLPFIFWGALTIVMASSLLFIRPKGE
jgi:MFS family permease